MTDLDLENDDRLVRLRLESAIYEARVALAVGDEERVEEALDDVAAVAADMLPDAPEKPRAQG